MSFSKFNALRKALHDCNIDKIHKITLTRCPVLVRALKSDASQAQYHKHFTEREVQNNEDRNCIFDQEVDVLKKQHLEDFVKIVDKFQKAKLVDLQKVLVLAQRLQAQHQGNSKQDPNKNVAHYTQLIGQLNSLNELNIEKIGPKIFDKPHEDASDTRTFPSQDSTGDLVKPPAKRRKNDQKKMKNEGNAVAATEAAKVKPAKWQKVKYSSKNEGIVAVAAEAATVKPAKRQKKYSLSDVEIVKMSSPKVALQMMSRILRMDDTRGLKTALESEKYLRNSAFLTDVRAFVDLCVKTGKHLDAHAYIANCALKVLYNPPKSTKSARRKAKHRPITDINIYTTLINAFAKKGHYEAVLKLYDMIEDMNLKPTMEIYAHMFECIGKETKSEWKLNTEAVGKLVADINRHGFNLEDIFLDKIYTPAEKELILQVLTPVVGEFIPKTRLPVYDYSCPLVDHLNGQSATPNPHSDIIDGKDVLSKLRRQINIEVQGCVTIKSVIPVPESLSDKVLQARANLEKHRAEWRTALKRAFLIKRNFLEVRTNQLFGDISIIPYLKLWPSDSYVDLMMQDIEMLGQEMNVYSPTIAYLRRSLGNKVYNKYIIHSRTKSDNLKKLMHIYQKYLFQYNKEKLPSTYRRIWNDLSEDLSYQPVKLQPWSHEKKKEVGKFLYEIIISEVKLHKPSSPPSSTSPLTSTPPSRSQPSSPTLEKKESPSRGCILAFYTESRANKDAGGIPMEEIVLHPLLLKMYKDSEIIELTFSPNDLPLLLPPVPWTDIDHGCHLLNLVQLIRHQWLCKDQLEWIKSLPLQQSYPVFDGLNTVAACPWRINKPILDIVIDVFNKGGNMKLDIPEKANKNGKIIKINSKMSDEEERDAWMNNRRVVKEDKEMYSLWCTELYRLSIANKYRDDLIWFPHSVDFRGRAYPTASHFNHLGNDVSRSLLEFGTGKKLGSKGLDWLKTHLINLTGFMKKKSNKDRLAYTNTIMDEVEDSSDRPMEGRKWWQNSDKPWQTLACCKEIMKAIRSPNPEEYISYLPVHQDGSCNGLQHYAALGRDEMGARSVSLLPSLTPQDVYSDVVELIEKARKADVEQGNKIAAKLEGFVNRKMVKQTIMTTVYGVTKYGAKQQIEKQLKDIKEFPSDLIFEAKCYLTEKTFQSLKKLFNSSEGIQDWFGFCTDLITTIQMKNISWPTPLGWPVIQPYVKPARMNYESANILFYEKPDRMKQTNAFPPNFIHSLDSTHMFLTAINCLRAGVLFVAVHDCFWTHACDVLEMNKICREQFIALYKERILENLSEHFQKEFGFSSEEISNQSDEVRKLTMEIFNDIFKRIPKKGNLDIDQILNSTYFFS